MLRDPRIWGPDADTFRPERFIGDGSKNLPDVSSVAFGFGKRCVGDGIRQQWSLNMICSICPGRHFAERLASVYVASILSIYEVTAVDGEEIPDPMPFVDGGIR
jgi:cytochrome P450